MIGGFLLFVRYPIYHIPSACFLTYHTQSLSYKGMYSIIVVYLKLKKKTYHFLMILSWIFINARAKCIWFCLDVLFYLVLVNEYFKCWCLFIFLSSILHVCITDNLMEDEEIPSSKDGNSERKWKRERSRNFLQPFGLATYKMQGNPETSNH